MNKNKNTEMPTGSKAGGGGGGSSAGATVIHKGSGVFFAFGNLQ